MKKILAALLVLLMLVGCSTKDKPEVEDPIIEDPSGPVGPIGGGWTINTDLPEMDDMIFDRARQKLTGASYSPFLVLGSQVTNGTNYQYLCYEKPVVPDAELSFKIVTVHKEEGMAIDATILNIADFEVTDYLNETGETTPEGLLNGWKENESFPNFLSEDENAIFKKAFEGFDGVGYTPIVKLASQVITGSNYAFLAVGTTMTAEPVTHFYVISISNDLEGNATVNNICGLNLASFNAD